VSLLLSRQPWRSPARSSADELGLERALSQLCLDQAEVELGRATTAVALAEAAARGDDSVLLLDNELGGHRLLLGRTDSAVDAALVRLHANADTILDDTEVGELPTLLTPTAARLITRLLNHEVHRGEAPGAEAQAAWVERELLAPLRAAGNLRGLCELCAGAAFLGAAAVQSVCVAQLVEAIECRTAKGVRKLFGTRVGQTVDLRLAFRSDCLVEGTKGALAVRRAFAAVLGGECGPAACLTQDLVEEVCLLVGANWVDSESALRAACAGGDRVVVLDGEITLDGADSRNRRLFPWRFSSGDKETDYTDTVRNYLSPSHLGYDDEYDDGYDSYGDDVYEEATYWNRYDYDDSDYEYDDCDYTEAVYDYETGEESTPGFWAPNTGQLQLADHAPRRHH